MIAVLARVTTLIEQLAAAGDEGLVLSDVAARAGLPPATATRLLQDLCTLGWADQAGPRGRYRLGPRMESLSNLRPYRGRLVAAATSILSQLADRFNAYVTLAILRNGHRLVLFDRGMEIAPLEERSDLYESASGRMLVAQLPWQARRRLMDIIGLPQSNQWREIGTWFELNATCAEARRQGYIINDQPSCPMLGVGAPVPDGTGGMAAIGMAVERQFWSPAVIDAVRAAAAAIAQRLTS